MATHASILENLDISPIPLTSQQSHLLSLDSALSELHLSHALLTAHAQLETSNDLPEITDPALLKAELAKAEQEALDARARYLIRERIVTQTIIADPILKAVHSDSEGADELTNEIKRALHVRDVLAMLHGDVSDKLAAYEIRGSDAEREIRRINLVNAQLAKEVVELAEIIRAPKTEDVEDDDMREKLKQADEDVARAKRKWRVLKSLTAGIVVASGVDWAGDEELTELVLDDEDAMR